MDNWDAVRTAYHVARHGTVSGAADALGVHHATVIRHIDALETRLGTKLFQRHPRGYTATEAGLDLLQVAKATDDQFAQLAGRIKGQGAEVSGDLVVTSISELSDQIAPLLVAFQRQYPDVTVRYLTGERLFRLAYGEAHVAIRAGSAPKEPDNVVQRFAEIPMAGFASADYVARRGLPEDGDAPRDADRHCYVASDAADSRAPYFQWLRRHVPDNRITFRANDTKVLNAAVLAGAGIGWMRSNAADRNPDLVQVYAPRAEWAAPVWLVTHVDLHRTSKVQAALAFLKEAAKAQTP